MVADDCADARADVVLIFSRPSFVIAANAQEFRVCDPSAELFGAPWVVQDASESFGRRHTTGIVLSNVVIDLVFGIGYVCLTVAQHP